MGDFIWFCSWGHFSLPNIRTSFPSVRPLRNSSLWGREDIKLHCESCSLLSEESSLVWPSQPPATMLTLLPLSDTYWEHPWLILPCSRVGRSLWNPFMLYLVTAVSLFSPPVRMKDSSSEIRQDHLKLNFEKNNGIFHFRALFSKLPKYFFSKYLILTCCLLGD